MNKQKKGFTLLEMLVVVFIIGILAAIAIPTYKRSVEKGKAMEAFEILSNIRNRQEQRQHFDKSRQYTTTFSDLGEVISGIPAPQGNVQEVPTKYFTYTLHGPNPYYATAVRRAEGGKAPPYSYSIKQTDDYMDSYLCCVGDDCPLISSLVKGCPCPDGFETTPGGGCPPLDKTKCDTYKNGDQIKYQCCLHGSAPDGSGRYWRNGDCKCPEGMSLDSNNVCVAPDLCAAAAPVGSEDYKCCSTGDPWGQRVWVWGKGCICPDSNNYWDTEQHKCLTNCPRPLIQGLCCAANEQYVWGTPPACNYCDVNKYKTSEDPTQCCAQNYHYCSTKGGCRKCPCDKEEASDGSCITGGGGGDGTGCDLATHHMVSGNCCLLSELYYWGGSCQYCNTNLFRTIEDNSQCCAKNYHYCKPNGCQECPCGQSKVNGSCVPDTQPPGPGGDCTNYQYDRGLYNCCLTGGDSYGRVWSSDLGDCVCPDPKTNWDPDLKRCVGCLSPKHIVDGNCCASGLNFYWNNQCQYCDQDLYQTAEDSTKCCTQNYHYCKPNGCQYCPCGQTLVNGSCVKTEVTCDSLFTGDALKSCKCVGYSNKDGSINIPPSYGFPIVDLKFATDGCCAYLSIKDNKDPALQGTVCEICAQYQAPGFAFTPIKQL